MNSEKRRLTKVFLATPISRLLVLSMMLVPSTRAVGQEPEVLSLQTRIPLPGVKGHIDHFSVDVNGPRLFVAAVENHTLEVIDLKSGQRVHTVADLAEPQGVFYNPSIGYLFVACGLDGVTKILDGVSFQVLATVKFPDDADNIRYDPRSKGVIVGYAGAKQLRKREEGTGGLGFIDANGQKTGDIVIDVHSESFQLEQSGSRLFVNVPDKKEIEVVDTGKGAVLARWPVSPDDNFPMALDEAHHRLFIGVWKPPQLLVFDTQVGKQIAAGEIAGKTDDLFTIRFGVECMCSLAKSTLKFSNKKMLIIMTGSRATQPRHDPRQAFLFRSGESCLLWSRPRMIGMLKFVYTRRTEETIRPPAAGINHAASENEGDTMSAVQKQNAILILVSAIWIGAFAQIAAAQEIPNDYQQVMKIVGKQGDYKANVLKVNIPRNDLHIKIAGYSVPTPFGFGGWFAMTKGDGGEDVVMGDLVLTQEEVNPVMSALLDHGLEVTALHNHFFWDEPRVFFMHIHGHGKALDLANQLKPAIDLIGQSKPASGGQTPSAAPKQSTLDAEGIAKIVGHAGEQNGPVYKITIGRDDLDVKEMGATINARMGLNTWAAFVGTTDDAAVAGDIAMLESEVQPTLKALRAHGLEVVAIHHHMINSRPVIIFLHYWGRGPAEKLATGFRAALDELGKAKQ